MYLKPLIRINHLQLVSIFTSVICSECHVVVVDSNKISVTQEVGILSMASGLTNGHLDVY